MNCLELFGFVQHEANPVKKTVTGLGDGAGNATEIRGTMQISFLPAHGTSVIQTASTSSSDSNGIQHKRGQSFGALMAQDRESTGDAPGADDSPPEVNDTAETDAKEDRSLDGPGTDLQSDTADPDLVDDTRPGKDLSADDKPQTVRLFDGEDPDAAPSMSGVLEPMASGADSYIDSDPTTSVSNAGQGATEPGDTLDGVTVAGMRHPESTPGSDVFTTQSATENRLVSARDTAPPNGDPRAADKAEPGMANSTEMTPAAIRQTGLMGQTPEVSALVNTSRSAPGNGVSMQAAENIGVGRVNGHKDPAGTGFARDSGSETERGTTLRAERTIAATLMEPTNPAAQNNTGHFTAAEKTLPAMLNATRAMNDETASLFLPDPLTAEGAPEGREQPHGFASRPELVPASASSSTFDFGTARPETVRHAAARAVEILIGQPGKPVEISLSPEELGKVRMALSTSETGVTVVITSERPETLDLMRRHIGQLAQEFQRLGYDSTSFQFNDQSAEEKEHAGHHKGLPRHPAATSEIDTHTVPTRLILSGLDLRL